MSLNKINKIKKNIKKSRNFDNEILDLIKKIKFIDDKEKSNFQQRVKNKGINIYFDIISFLEKQNIELNYHNISSINIYDKRVRDILYSFIAFIEEYFRAKIINQYDVKANDIKNIYELHFSEILFLAKKCEILSKNDYNSFLKNIQLLRNDVFHNKFILIKYSKPHNKNIEKIKTLALYLEKIKIDNTNMKVEFIEKIKKEEAREINDKYNLNKKLKIPNDIKLSNLLK